MRNHGIRFALAAAAIVLTTASADADVREFVYAKIDGIEGDSTSTACPKCIRLLSASYALTIEVPLPGAPGDTEYGDLMTTKRFDSSSAKLLVAAFQGKKFGVVVKFVRRYDTGPYVYAELELDEAALVAVSADGGHGARPVESHAFTYRKLCLKTRGGTPDRPGTWEGAQCVIR